MNKYGYFKYSDFAVGAKENASYSADIELQEGSSLTQLHVGVEPYQYASLELDDYVTSKPKKIYRTGELGLLTKATSDGNGNLPEAVVLTISFTQYFSMTGITINSRNIIKGITIQAFRDNIELINKTFSAKEKNNFYDIPFEFANKLVLTITKIDEPYHFLGIYGIEFGKLRIFDDTNIISAEISNYFSVLGDTLEYDTLDLRVVDPEKEDYLFQRKQPIDFIVNDQQKARFYIDSGTEDNNNTLQVLAYDEISSLEDDFYGGMYDNYPLNDLIADILSGTDIKYEAENTDDIYMSGYLPISSRRKALQTILRGSNIRCYKGERLVFKPLDTQGLGIVLDEDNILDNPRKTKKQEIRSVTVKQKKYSKSKEEKELYKWYISTTENVVITFDSPAHSLKAYEVIGVDENDQDIISETESENVTFIEADVNYCVVSNTSSNKIVIKGLGYTESTVSYKKINPLISTNEIYEDKAIELTISSKPKDVCALLYNLYSRKNSITFKTLVDVIVGKNYRILGEYLNIKSKKQTLDGIYEVEAV